MDSKETIVLKVLLCCQRKMVYELSYQTKHCSYVEIQQCWLIRISVLWKPQSNSFKNLESNYLELFNIDLLLKRLSGPNIIVISGNSSGMHQNLFRTPEIKNINQIKQKPRVQIPARMHLVIFPINLMCSLA